MSKNAVNWFEIPVKNMDRAKNFYSNVLKKDLMHLPSPGPSKMAAFPWTEGAEFSAGALVEGEGYEPSTTGSVVYFYCEDLSNELTRVEKNGGKILVPKTDIGEHGFISHIMDTEGNRVALHSRN